MNIAIYASAFHPHVGGVEELVRQLAHEYARQGHQAIVLTNRWPRDLPAHEVFENIPVYRLPMRVPEGSIKAHVNYHLTHRRITRQMLSILRDHEIDVIHVQCVSSNGYYARLASKELDLPLVVTAQGERTMDAAGLYEHSAFMNAVLRELLETADRITACSRDTLDDIELWFGRSLSDRASVIHNGIRVADFASVEPWQHPRPYLLSMGRLVPQKGFDVLIEAFARANVPGYDLLIAGEGPSRQSLEQLVAYHGLGDRVWFIGAADRARAVQLLHGCSFFALASHREPLGIVNLEAMAAGKPTLSTRAGGVPEIVLGGVTGLLVPPGDAGAMAGAIQRLAEDQSLRLRLGEAGRRRAAEFDWPVLADRYLDVYEQAMLAYEDRAPQELTAP